MILKLFSFLKTHIVWVVLCAIVVGVTLHCLTLSYSPIPWVDEVQIHEIARGGVGEKNTTWNMALINGNGQLDSQAWAIYYLGGLSAELGYILWGHSGGRFLNLVWLLLATGLLTSYIYKKTRNKSLSCLIGVLFFTFPPLCQSLRGGRADILAFMFLFAALLCLRLNSRSHRNILLCYALSSACAICAIFSWITAILCMPIVLWEVFEIFKERELTLRQRMSTLILMGMSGFAMLIALLIPFLIHYQASWDTFLKILTLNSSISSRGPYFKEFFKLLLALPFVYIIGLPLLFLRKRFILLAIATVCISIIAVMTHCYTFRILYLLPYALIGIALIDRYIQSPLKRHVYNGLLILLICIGYSFSILLRNGTEFFAKNVRSVNRAKEILQVEVGTNVRIYCDTFQLYYIGRELNWNQYRLALSSTNLEELFNTLGIEYFITEKKNFSPTLKMVLAKEGFELKKEITVVDLNNLSQMEQFLNSLGRLSPYGPYLLYAKKELLR